MHCTLDTCKHTQPHLQLLQLQDTGIPFATILSCSIQHDTRPPKQTTTAYLGAAAAGDGTDGPVGVVPSEGRGVGSVGVRQRVFPRYPWVLSLKQKLASHMAGLISNNDDSHDDTNLFLLLLLLQQ